MPGYSVVADALTSLRPFGNANYPNSCRLDVFGEIEIDPNSHKAKIYFSAASESREDNGDWFPDVIETTYAKKGTSSSVTFFKPKLLTLSVKLYHEYFASTAIGTAREPLELESLTTGLDLTNLFDKEAYIKRLACARTVQPIPFGYKEGSLVCQIEGTKYGGYWAGAHQGKYGSSDLPKRTDNVNFSYMRKIKIPNPRDIPKT